MNFAGGKHLIKSNSMWIPGEHAESRNPKLTISYLLNKNGDMSTNETMSRLEREHEDKMYRNSRFSPQQGSTLRPYKCNQCPAAFTQKHDLSKHVW